MAVSVDSSSPSNFRKASVSLMGSPLISPSTDKRIWSALSSRVDTLLENRTCEMNARESDGSKRLKEDSLLLLRGFDSIAHTLSQLSRNLDSAIQGTRDLSKPPTLTEILHSKLERGKSKENKPEEEEEEEEENDPGEKILKRKSEDDAHESYEDQADNSIKKNDHRSPKDGNLKNAKKLAVSMATKAASVTRELKSIKSDLCFMQERCAWLEEENVRLRDGFFKEIRPEDDDLVMLQLEALLAEKSRLANENANLTREIQCLKQVLEYHHQLGTRDLSPSHEQALSGTSLDFSSEEGDPRTPQTNIFKILSIDDCSA